MITRKWEPINPLSGDCGYDFSVIDSLQRQWLEYRRVRETAGADAFRHFQDRLTRSWAIETGIIEGLYTLDLGTTQTLVMRGISADLIEPGSTNKTPQELALVLDDHQDVVNGIYEEIREGWSITRSAIRQLHQALTRNQPTFRAMNQFGQLFDSELRHGEFKSLPNNPTTVAGALHEYCPPEHVDSELDNLLAWYGEYLEDRNRHHPLLVAAWLHHRFTQIHPFQDGNGRVVRALLTWHLVRENYLPVVVKRDDREDYIRSLESADNNDLVPFIDLLVRLQRRTILEAFGEPYGPLDRALDRIAPRLARRNAKRETDMRSVNAVAETLRDYVEVLLNQHAEQILYRFVQAGTGVACFVDRGGPWEQGYWSNRIDDNVRKDGYWINSNESRFFVRLSLTATGPLSQSRLDFVVSMYHTGRQLTGVMASTASGFIELSNDANADPIEVGMPDAFVYCGEPFTFTWESDTGTLLSQFDEWCERCLARTLEFWGPFLG